MRSRRWWIIGGTCCRSFCDAEPVVILNGGEAGVRDRTTFEGSDDVEGNAHEVCGVTIPVGDTGSS